MHVVIFTGGTVRKGRFSDQALAAADLIVAADSGGAAALAYDATPSVVIGDFDSLDRDSKATLELGGCQFITHNSAKDQTDTELAISYALDQKADRITLIGGSEGDRLDHILANVFLAIAGPVPIILANGPMKAWVETGPAEVTITGAADDLLSLIPLTPEVTEVRTTHLQYPLKAEILLQNQARGLSNVLTAAEARVSFSGGNLLFVHTSID